tara:strand:+ start:650 stop:829 length:180 start_codon:yes stop_codon:yes gene_type:complete
MSYLTKKECYDDVLKSLKLNIISYPDKELLLKYYEEDEDYLCCQGVLEAYKDYEKLLLL